LGQRSSYICLHHARLNGSRAQSILWLLEELEIPYDLEIYHRQKNMLAPRELRNVHPLGKSPAITVTSPNVSEPIVLAETAFIVQYMCDHFPKGKTLVPQRWKDGREGKVGGETEEWMRYQYLMHYIEGSFMPTMVLNLILSGMQASTDLAMHRALTCGW
jgi:glutathione S-transferase